MALDNIFQRPLVQRWNLAEQKNYVVHDGGAVVWVLAEDPAITSTNSPVEEVALPNRGDIWPQLTPLYFDDITQTAKVWTAGRAIEGFLLGATGISTQLYGANNRHGRMKLFSDTCAQALVLIYGQVHAPDVFLPPGESLADLQDALRSGLREDGINITGLYGTH